MEYSRKANKFAEYFVGVFGERTLSMFTPEKTYVRLNIKAHALASISGDRKIGNQ